MTTSDTIAAISVLVATVALILSGVSLYFQFFRRLDDVRIYVVSERYLAGRSDVPPLYQIGLAAFNRGTRSAQMIGGEMRVDAYFQPPKPALDKSTGAPLAPIVLAPGDTVYLDIYCCLDEAAGEALGDHTVSLWLRGIGQRPGAKTLVIDGFHYYASADGSSHSHIEPYNEVYRLL